MRFSKRIVFSARTAGKLPKIYSIGANGGAAEQLTSGERAYLDPAWLADGKSLVFGHDLAVEIGKSSTRAIEVMDLKTRQIPILPGFEGLWHPG